MIPFFPIWLLSLSVVFLKSVMKYSMMVKVWSNESNTSQYWSSTVCPCNDQHGQAKLIPRTYDAVTATELYTVIPVRQMRSWNKLLRSPGPTEALIIEASFCVFVRLGPCFWIQIPNLIACICTVLSVHVNMYSMCFAFFPLQNKVQRMCKERRTKKKKKCVRQWENEIFLTVIPRLA